MLRAGIDLWGERKPERHGDTTGMKVEILHFDGCPTYRATENTLKQVLVEKGIEAEVELVAVNSDEEARRLRFPGSPTIRVDGRDPFHTPECEDWRLVCQVYATPEGLMGSPTAQMLKAALL
jgi:glutaredoxin